MAYTERAELPDVAELEWAWHRAFHAPDEPGLDLEALGRVDADATQQIRFRLPAASALLVPNIAVLAAIEELAQRYVRDTHNDLTEVAFVLGFADLSTFSRSFKRWTGVSPSKYRKVEA